MTNILKFSKSKGCANLARDGVVICLLGYKNNKYSINSFLVFLVDREY
jgi:hypothetical protein